MVAKKVKGTDIEIIKDPSVEEDKEQVMDKMDTVNKVLNQKLEDLEGIGSVRLKKLYNTGIYTISDLLSHGEESISRMLDITWEDARKMIVIANESINTDAVFSSLVVSGKEYADYRKKRIKYLTTGLEEFDEITGGYETGVITEFFGAFGAGKTQITEVACIMAQMPKDKCCLHCGVKPEDDFKGEKCEEKVEGQKTPCGGTIWNGGGLSDFGKFCRVIYIDTENSYRPERVLGIIYNRELVLTKPQNKTDEKKQTQKEPLNDEEEEKALDILYNIDISRPRTSALQMLVVNNLSAMIDGDLCKKCHIREITKDGLPTHPDHEKVKKDKDGKIKDEDLVLTNHNFVKDKKAPLVVIDSFTGRFRKEYEGRGTLSDRQNKLKSHVKVLESVVESKNVICLVTNQVSEKMDLAGSHNDTLRPIGGNEIGHTFTHRIYLKKAQALNKDKITAILVDSPNHAKNEVVMELGGKGIQKYTEG